MSHRRHRFGSSVGRSPGGGHGNPLQYCCLENHMDRGVWQVTVHVSQGVRHDWGDLAHTHQTLRIVASIEQSFPRALVVIIIITLTALRKRKERRPKENEHLPEVASPTWDTEMTSDSPWREVAFGVNFRFSRSSWWQAITWYRRIWGIRPPLSQSLICNRSKGSSQS